MHYDLVMALGPKLRRLRQRRSLSQQALARRLRVKREYIAQIELGAIKSPRIETRRRMAKARGVPITELLE
jgi:transcriptional regulator with XRE-family HTH domain